MKSLYESLIILDKCNLTIQRLRDAIEVNQDVESRFKSLDYHILDLSNYIIMETVSFLDEYHNYFLANTDSEFKQRLSEIGIINKPILKKINHWKDLQKFRNEVIAHTWRIGKSFNIPSFNKYSIPRTPLELNILVNLVAYVYQIIYNEFFEEHKQAYKELDKVIDKSEPPEVDFSNLNKEQMDIRLEVETLCKKFNKAYTLKIFMYYIDDEDDDAEVDKYGYPIKK